MTRAWLVLACCAGMSCGSSLGPAIQEANDAHALGHAAGVVLEDACVEPYTHLDDELDAALIDDLDAYCAPALDAYVELRDAHAALLVVLQQAQRTATPDRALVAAAVARTVVARAAVFDALQLVAAAQTDAGAL